MSFFTEGYLAFQDGMTLDDCPYTDTNAKLEWLDGFCCAENEG